MITSTKARSMICEMFEFCKSAFNITEKSCLVNSSSIVLVCRAYWPRVIIKEKS